MKLRFLLSLVCLSALLSAHPASAASGPELGLQTWTCRNMNFDQVVAFASAHGLKQIEFITAQLDPNADPQENLRKKKALAEHGLTAYSFGVNRPELDKEANRKLFEFAKLMGMKVIAVEPQNLAAWDNIEQLVKEYDIKVAIHNHNLDSVYGNPATVKQILAKRDHRIGVCLDIGWITAAGFDAAAVFHDYGDRVYDIHFKDKEIVMTDGKPTPVDTEIGKGKANYKGLFAEIKKSGWSGVMAIETDSKAFAENPNRLVDEARIFFDAQVAAK